MNITTHTLHCPASQSKGLCLRWHSFQREDSRVSCAVNVNTPSHNRLAINHSLLAQTHLKTGFVSWDFQIFRGRVLIFRLTFQKMQNFLKLLRFLKIFPVKKIKIAHSPLVQVSPIHCSDQFSHKSWHLSEKGFIFLCDLNTPTHPPGQCRTVLCVHFSGRRRKMAPGNIVLT